MKTRWILLILLVIGLAAQPAHAQADDLLAKINGLRGSLGLAPYALNGALSVAAQNHAAWMAATKQISHNQSNGSTPSTRAQAAGYPGRWVSENIYGGTSAGSGDAWNFWVNSPIHYRGLTNANYQDIGIGIASADGWNFFVLVFGNASQTWGSASVSGGSGSGGGSSAASGPPPFIVGYDNDGNIMHEIQESQTLGDILLIYGYTWDDLPTLLSLNGLTQNDIRRLPIGGVLLVPPHGGTYTPTPYPPNYQTPTPLPEQIAQTETAAAILMPTHAAATQYAAILLTPIYTLTPSATPTPEPSAIVTLGRPATAAAIPAVFQPPPTFTPSPTVEQVAALATPAPLTDITAAPPANGLSPLLMVAVVLQVVIVLSAGFEFVRRARRR
jgi:hypothetical protein